MIGALAARNNLRVKNARQPNLILIGSFWYFSCFWWAVVITQWFTILNSLWAGSHYKYFGASVSMSAGN